MNGAPESTVCLSTMCACLHIHGQPVHFSGLLILRVWVSSCDRVIGIVNQFLCKADIEVIFCLIFDQLRIDKKSINNNHTKDREIDSLGPVVKRGLVENGN
jgi:hypothetical protein